MNLSERELLTFLESKRVKEPEKYFEAYQNWHLKEDGKALNILFEMILHNDMNGGLSWTRTDIEKVLGKPYVDPSCPHDVTYATKDESVVHALFFEDEADREKITAWNKN